VDSAWIEFLIPVTIVATSISNLFKKNFEPKSLNINYYLALVFGLIHGMGFANAVRMMLPKGDGMISSLLAFNLGLEVGQLFFVAVILIFAWVLITKLKVDRKNWIIFLSAAAFALATKMALERWPM
jgi:ABC-type antimicrobial peptide transport system permease subunit